VTAKKIEMHHAKPQFISLKELKQAVGKHNPSWVFTQFGESLIITNNFIRGLSFNGSFIKNFYSNIHTQLRLSPIVKFWKDRLIFRKKVDTVKNIAIDKKDISVNSVHKETAEKKAVTTLSLDQNTSSEISNLVTLDAGTIGLLNSFKKGMRFLQVTILLVFVVLGIQSYLILTGTNNINFQASANNQVLETVTSLPVNSEPGLRIITNFTTNKGVIDIGYSLDVQKEIIKMKNTSNCKTPNIPPLQNGCNVTVLPSALGIPARGTIFKNIQFEGSIPKDSKIKMDIKDFEQGDLTQDLGSFGQEKIGKPLDIPANIGGTQGIYLRLWTLGGEISITKIAIEYYNVDQLKPVSGKINPELLQDVKSFVVWEDKDQNRLWDPKIDVIWNCRPNFSGVLPLEVGANGNFVMQRDDICFTDVKPDKWYVDKGINVLPNGRWLLVSQEPEIVIPFEVLNKTDKTVMEINGVDDVKYK
jgi:hypothetical protein